MFVYSTLLLPLLLLEVPLAAVDTGRGDHDEEDQEGDPQAEAELCREVCGVCGGFLVVGTGGGGSG